MHHHHKNGKSHHVKHVANAALAAGGDPMDRIASMGGSHGSTIIAVAIAGAILFHGGVAAAGGAAMLLDDFIAWQRGIKGAVADKLAQTYEIENEKPKDEPPPPKVEEKDDKPQPVAQKDQPKDEPPPQPPEAAKAGAVLAAAPDPNEPVDLTGNTFVTGTGDQYAGGVTQAKAQGGPTYARNAVAEGVPGGTGTAPAPPPPPPPAPSVDRSRAPRLAGGTGWDCPWPSEAEGEDINEAVVVIKATVGVDGRPQTVQIVSDPGHGFGREAKMCALRKRWEAGLDKDGNPTTATAPVRIRFTR